MTSATWHRGRLGHAPIYRIRTWSPDGVDSTFFAMAIEQAGREDGIGRDSTFEFDAEELRDLMMSSFDRGEQFKYC